MKSSFAFAVLSLFASQCLSVSVDMWSSPLTDGSAPVFESIEPDVIKSRLGTTPKENDTGDRKPGTVYFCREENWGAPCFAYHPKLEYYCNELSPQLSGHVGSVFVEPEIICRLATIGHEQCSPIKFFAWPETQHGWPDLFHQDAPQGGKLGSVSTHFTCAKCTNCVRDPK
ncbi:hypothetical protein BFJ63_vAg19675 [Fusarium oxysporum f. sp. narcissi]|uniref:Uncharacterized protein n=1 Tax=Fusarium oxysporum f. sp. narcissi TaxID=451672 RepID=A0A4Q2UTE1_FUSOX|nr:hypothetical protein BFJ63_vAg19675 [Fusarium oxysporum f. sp. narcissi]